MSLTKSSDLRSFARQLHYYKLFGMAVRSEVEFPEFTLLPPDERLTTSLPWVDVVYTDVPETLPDSFKVVDWIEATKTECLFHVAEKCRLLVSNGSRLSLDLYPGVDLKDVRPYLTTCGFATLAFQNQYLPLHVSAAETPKGVVLFAGPSGAGKSTLAVGLKEKLGWPLLGDDLAVCEISGPAEDGIRGSCHFGVNKVKLWESASDALELDKTNLEQDFFRPYKYHIRVSEGRALVPITDISAIVKLQWSDHDARLIPSTKSVGYETVMNSIYPPYMAQIYLDLVSVRSKVLQLMAGLDAYTLYRTNATWSLDSSIDALNQHFS